MIHFKFDIFFINYTRIKYLTRELMSYSRFNYSLRDAYKLSWTICKKCYYGTDNPYPGTAMKKPKKDVRSFY
jgi:hypothetical protein